ncbi:unnamed protein product [Rotaria sordida]|uniref:Uncharacterized protein n=1 Tax=Rotaria sordida TaxID=392033 RepID=A0A813WU71_9BILA|nr:unnamed protein product [Rotaria sordida]
MLTGWTTYFNKYKYIKQTNNNQTKASNINIRFIQNYEKTIHLNFTLCHNNFLCTISNPCPYGYIFDKFNCNTCECNPCKLGQPLRKYSCKKGRYSCSRRKGICTVSTQGNLHCCPLKRSGSCPPSPHPSVVLCLPVDCKNDGDCSIGQKCCKPCLRCTNVTDS